ncbi:hypothetical protein P9112_011491 [Eukaryota sp. TZLM1-RC]
MDDSEFQSVTLTQSELHVPFSRPSTAVFKSQSEELYESTISSNMKYEQTLLKYASGRDHSLLADHYTQTLAYPLRSQGTQFNSLSCQSKGITVGETLISTSTQSTSTRSSASSSMPSSLPLNKVESTLHQNINWKWLLNVFSSNSDDISSFKVKSSKVLDIDLSGMIVYCFSLSPNGNYLAIGLGNSDSFSPGHVFVFDILSNSFSPICSIPCPSPVTSIGLPSYTNNPLFVAAGLMDGHIKVIDIFRSNCIFQSSVNSKHTGPVSALYWGHYKSNNYSTNREEEILLTVSRDGYARSWKVSQNFDSCLVMKFKIIANPLKLINQSEPFVNRLAAPLCCCFESINHNCSYLVGTFDGLVLKCLASTSTLVEQFQAFIGHSTAVQSISSCPMNLKYFASADSSFNDTSVVIWKDSNTSPLFSLPCNRPTFTVDLAWCPFNCKVLAVAEADGIIEFWDLVSVYSESVDTPLFTIDVSQHYENFSIEQVSISSIKWNKECPLLIVGFSDGGVLLIEVEVPLFKDISALNVLGRERAGI